MLPEAPTDDTACLYYVKLKNSERIIMLAYTGNGEWTDTEGKEYKGIETWLEYMPKEHQIGERKAFLNEDILKAIVRSFISRNEVKWNRYVLIEIEDLLQSELFKAKEIKKKQKR